MNDPRIDHAKRQYVALRDALLAAYRDDDLDERTLTDTLEGATDLRELLARAVRATLDDETMAALLKVRMSEMADRLERFERRAEHRRQIVRDAMLDAGIERLNEPDFSASMRKGPPHVVVIEEKLIPPEFFEMRPHLRKRDLLESLKGGAQIAGASLSNPGMSLVVRTR